jgi:hypothetical protein
MCKEYTDQDSSICFLGTGINSLETAVETSYPPWRPAPLLSHIAQRPDLSLCGGAISGKADDCIG